MTRDEVLNYVLESYGTEPDFPWRDDNAVLRHDADRKWYAVLLRVRRSLIGLPGGGVADVLNIKCDPLMNGTLRQKRGFRPAYHMSKLQWISILLEEDETPDAAEVCALLDMSWQMTLGKRKARGAKGE